MREIKIIGGRSLLRDYNDLRSQGYVTLWSGNGQICMEAPEKPITIATEVAEEQQ